MKKILLISDATLDGGTNNTIYNILKVVKKMSEHEFSLLLDDNENMTVMVQKCELLGIKVYREKIYHGKYSDVHVKMMINNVIDSVEPDVVHVFCASIRSAITIRETVMERGIQMFSTETYVVAGYPITEEDLRRVKDIYEKTECVITVSYANIKVLSEDYGIDASNIYCIPTSCDMKGKLYKKRVIGDQINAVVLARLSKQKGIDILIEAFHLLDEKTKEKYRIDVIGDGELKDELLQQLHKYALEEYIHFLGWQDNPTDNLGQYNLGIIPSRHEGLPNVVLELLDAGIPVIISDVEGILEATNNGEYAEIFPKESVQGLCRVLINVSETPETIMKKTDDAIKYIREHYNMETNYGKYIEMWERGISRGEIGKC